MGTGLLNSSASKDPRAPQLDDTIIDLLPAAVYVCDAEGLIVRYNLKAVELWGREPQVGDPDERFCGAFRLFRPDGRPLPHPDTPMAETLRTGRPARDLEVVIERPDGTRIWALVNISPTHDSDGKLTGAINCFQDITARRDAERQVRESRAFLQAVIETTPECVKLIGADGVIQRINPAGLVMLEATSTEEAVGRAFRDFIAPEHQARWDERHRRVCGGESLIWEFDVVGLQGTRRHMESHAVPFALADGATGQLAMTCDITRRKQDERALREGEQRLRQLFEALPVPVYTTDAPGTITFYNRAAATFWGREPVLGEDSWCGSWRLFRPDGSPLPHDQCPMAVALKEQRALENAEAVAARPDGTRVPFLAFPTPLRDAEGTMVGAVNMLVDISQQKRAEARQQLLINELNHRVKNTLATVQSIAAFSLRSASSAEAFRDAFGARLMALSRAHDLLTQRRWEGAELKAVLDQQFAPYVAESPSRVLLSGEEVSLGPRAALVLSMAFHELATNAAKYGALSVEEGRLEIHWAVEPVAARTDAGAEAAESTGRSLLLTWSEYDGPPVTPPSRRGFGSRLIERGITADLEGEVRLNYLSQGLHCELRIPLGG